MEQEQILDKKQPEIKLKAWPITATLWENNSDLGKYESVQITRSYKDKDDNWMNTQSLRESDIPKTIFLLNKIYDYLLVKKLNKNNLKKGEV